MTDNSIYKKIIDIINHEITIYIVSNIFTFIIERFQKVYYNNYVRRLYGRIKTCSYYHGWKW